MLGGPSGIIPGPEDLGPDYIPKAARLHPSAARAGRGAIPSYTFWVVQGTTIMYLGTSSMWVTGNSAEDRALEASDFKGKNSPVRLDRLLSLCALPGNTQTP